MNYFHSYLKWLKLKTSNYSNICILIGCYYIFVDIMLTTDNIMC